MNSGSLAEVVGGIELIAGSPDHQRGQLFYWSTETGGNAEVDYVIQQGSNLVPIEIKASHRGKMHSLYRFLQLKQKSLGIRSSLERFTKYNAPSGQAKVSVVPLYALGDFAQRG